MLHEIDKISIIMFVTHVLIPSVYNDSVKKFSTFIKHLSQRFRMVKVFEWGKRSDWRHNFDFFAPFPFFTSNRS